MQIHIAATALLAVTMIAAPAAAAEVRENPQAPCWSCLPRRAARPARPADAKLVELGKKGDIITLAYHVDYWDYIGWPDTFATKANSDLQRSYAQSWGSSRIYTPQLIVNGTEGVVGSRDGEVSGALKAAKLGVAG